MECLVSVIIPVFNVEKYLTRCLQSVVNQSYANIEVICVNDCTPDQSQRILDHFTELDSRIRCITTKYNMGLSGARNEGLKEANGKYVFFLDSDDYLEENCLEVLVDNAESENTDLLGCAFFTEYENDGLKKGFNAAVSDKREIEVCKGTDYLKKDISSQFIHVTTWSYLYSKAFLDGNGLLFEPGIIHEDFLFYYQCMMKATRVKLLSVPLYHYCIREKSIMTNDKTRECLLNELESYAVIIYRLLFLQGNKEDMVLNRTIIKFVEMAVWNIKRIYAELRNKGWDSLIEYEHSESNYIIPLALIDDILYNENAFFTYDDLKKIQKKKKVLIYGKGKWAQRIAKTLFNIQIDEVRFITSEEIKKEVYKDIKLEDYVIVIGSKKYQADMEKSLRSIGITSFVLPCFEC